MSTAPPPSKLVLLGDLTHCEAGQKVRFLGCVEEYVARDAVLRLKHNYPPSKKPVIACVDASIVLETIKRHELEVGAWINVIGYVQPRKKDVCVQAIAVWDAVIVDLETYQRAVEARSKSET
ncbi:hypothetical protein M011DRAFT_480476 [Sporormia fimetaria CBS 119925]|uniref:CST complex subunit Ten1 n=1 Tax=Sporormia fimetaria CBS 119925 TaxID=1340428 RepID=A0A6A6V3I7_9PLEO|nr:hypothetical protein M011DRAFT_480476 [Sporormia fimetaria CBS 119925]